MDDKVLESIKGKVSEEEYQAIVAVKDRNVLALAEDKVFALRDQSGEIKAFKQRVRLDAQAGTLIQPVPGGPWVVSAQGYEVLAEAAGAVVIFPRDVVADGEVHMNPYTVRDKSNGRVLAVFARAVAYRFSSKGLPQVCDWTSMFDLPAYRLIDLIAKAKDAPTVFRLLPIDQAPATQTEKETWAKYPFDQSTNLWVNTSHPGALDWYKQILNREKKAVDFCQTFAKRNATKHLLGIQKSPCRPNDVPIWDLTVFCWRPTSGNMVKWDYTRYAEVRAGIEDIAAGRGFGKAKVVKGREDVTQDLAQQVPTESDLDDAIDVEHQVVEPEATEDIAGDGAPEPSEPPATDQAEAPAPPPEPPAAPPEKPRAARAPKKKVEKPGTDPSTFTKEEATIHKSLVLASTAFPGAYHQALEQCKFTMPLTPAEMKVVENALHRILDTNI